MTETVAAIVAAHRAGTMTPAQTVARSYQRIRDHNDPAVFISLRDEKDALAEAEALSDEGRGALPLLRRAGRGEGQYRRRRACRPPPPARPSPICRHRMRPRWRRLRAAGAIVIGKTNLDQFATGLVGVRSPYGIPVNPIRADLIPGGSSSGSAVAVAAGLVPLALGTDTAGSGRVPAMLNNIVGLKPSLGLISTAGVVPACRTLDCVSVFSLTVDDAMTALAAMAGPDAADPFSRDRPLGRHDGISRPAPARRAAQRPTDLLRRSALRRRPMARRSQRWTALGATLVEFDLEPFYETARLLYEGPWVAERYLVIRDLLASSPESIHPVTREITVGRRAAHRGRHLRGALPAAGAARASPSAPSPISTRWCCRRRRPSTRSRRCWPIRSSSTAGSAPTPISSTCSISAASRCRRRCATTALRSASRCWRRRAATRSSPASAACSMPTPNCRSARTGMPQPPLARVAGGARGDEIAHRGGRRASVRHGAERRTEGARRAPAGSEPRPRRTTGSMRSTAPRRRSPACCASSRARDVDRARGLGAAGGGVRPIRRRDSAAAVDRHACALPTAAA